MRPDPLPLLGVNDALDHPDTATQRVPNNGNTGKRKAVSHTRHAAICLALHVFLIAVHLGLFVVYAGHYERRITMNINNFTSTWSPLIVTTVLQTVGTIYLAIIVLLTQRLALQRHLYERRTLTAIHDTTMAWLGLASSVTSLWNQTKLRTALGSISCITVYLLGLFTLHITIPGLFHIAPYNATMYSVRQTVLSNATYTDTTNVHGTDSLDVQLPALFYDVLPVYGQFPTLGLADTMVYDVIPSVPAASGNTLVNASRYIVDCAALTQLVPLDSTFETPAQPWELVYGVDGLLDTQLRIFVPPPYLSAIYPVKVTIGTGNFRPGAFCPTSGNATQDADGEYMANPIIFAATIPVLDSSGATIPWTPISPQVLQNINFKQNALISDVQLLACSVRIADTKVNVSSETRQPVSPPAPAANASWHNWTCPQDQSRADDMMKLNVAINAAIQSPASSRTTTFSSVALNPVNNTSNSSSPIEVVPVLAFPDSANTTTVLPGALEVFLREDLSIVAQNRSNVSLAEVNHSIARALAAVYWYGITVNYSDPHATAANDSPDEDSSQLSRFSPMYGEATIPVSVLRLQLNLSLTPLIIGTLASLALLGAALFLIRLPRHPSGSHTAGIDTAGILQLTWLLGNDPHLAAVAEPRLHALRSAGMFEVPGVRAAVYGGGEKMGSGLEGFGPYGSVAELRELNRDFGRM